MTDTLEMKPTDPLHTSIWADEHYEGIDPGIRYAVRVLHYAGIPTCQSCQGGEGHAYDYPTVDLAENRAFEAMNVLERHGVSVRSVSSVWDIVDGVPNERIWRVALRSDLTALADTRPMFLTAHLHNECWTAVEAGR